MQIIYRKTKFINVFTVSKYVYIHVNIEHVHNILVDNEITRK